MPTYVCVVKAGLLNATQKQHIAAAITRLHSESTGAPTWLVMW
jgi:phenylpyruvate tautomerase PptA (4-oxalocrotonate tautomerase family)